jgi:hypothetical protein
MDSTSSPRLPVHWPSPSRIACVMTHCGPPGLVVAAPAGMEAVLSAQKQLLQLVQSCVSGHPAERPGFSALGRQLKALHQAFAQGAKDGVGGSEAPTPASTPRS